MKCKRVYRIILCVCLALILASCGSTAPAAPKAEQQENASDKTGSETNAPEAVEAEAEETEAEEAESAAEEGNGFVGKGNFETTVLLDENGVKITATPFSYSEYAATMYLEFENHTDQALTFKATGEYDSFVSVNGYEFPTLWVFEKVDPEETKKEELYISKDDLNALGITDIAEMEFRIVLLDGNNEKYLETGPLKLPTSSAPSYDLTEDTYQKAVEDGRFAEYSEVEVEAFVTGNWYSEEGVELLSAALVKTNDGRREVYLELENTSDEIKNFTFRQFGVNQLIIEKGIPKGLSLNWFSLNPHGRCIAEVYVDNLLSPEAFASLGIGEITEISFEAALGDKDEETRGDETLVVIPLAEKTEEAGRSGDELYNSGGIRILLAGSEENDTFYYFLMTVINDTEDTILVSDSGTSLKVNGMDTAQDNYIAAIAPGQAGIVKTGLRKHDSSISLEQNGIAVEEIEAVEFDLRFFKDGENIYFDTPFETASLAIHP